MVQSVTIRKANFHKTILSDGPEGPQVTVEFIMLSGILRFTYGISTSFLLFISLSFVMGAPHTLFIYDSKEVSANPFYTDK